ncbi:MAG: AtpZ/AtpI family protein [Proteobacteria bacterium]|nr:AtpZ/AtpI family protein [Pseudomonadota bacterium]
MTDRIQSDRRLQAAVHTRQARRERWQREGERSMGQNLAMIGALGWTIVLPTLIGMFMGRWLDRLLGMGIFWTLGLLAAGLTLGCVLGWKRMHGA